MWFCLVRASVYFFFFFHCYKRGLFLPAVTCSICLFPPAENRDYDRDVEDQWASEGKGLQDEHAAPDGNFYTALSPATSSGSATIDTPTLTVQCSKDSFLIVLRAGRLSDVHVKGMCQGAAVCKTTTATCKIDLKLTRPPFSDSKNARNLSVTALPNCGYQVNYEKNTVTVPFTGCHVQTRVDCNVSGYARD